MPTRREDRLIICQHLTFVRFFQPGDDIEQCGFAATARSDNDDKLALRDLERNIIQRMDRLSLLLKPFRNVVDHEFRRGRTLQLFLERH